MPLNDNLGLTRETILVVDDEPANLSFLSELLTDEVEVLIAKSGEQALKRAQGGVLPDLILLDVMMPDMDGFEVCRRLKADTRTAEIPVIFITALNDGTDEITGLELGACDYISRPFAPEVVRARVRNQIKIMRLTTDLQVANETLRRVNKELKEANAELTRLAKTDPLTGAANRRHFFEHGNKELSRCRRHGHQLSVAMLDIDNFKRINDSYGHETGDEVLIAFVGLAKDVLRDEDLFSRLGGEEFAVLLPETGLEGGIRTAERIRAAVEAHSQKTAQGPLRATVSIGVAPVDDEDGLEAALSRADTALYEAKHGGRNQVVAAPPR